jgi:late competence protein required for DNA uptake (superfamily II DNA/RNA helicase)
MRKNNEHKTAQIGPGICQMSSPARSLNPSAQRANDAMQAASLALSAVTCGSCLFLKRVNCNSKEKETKNTQQQNKKRESSAREWPCTEEERPGKRGASESRKGKEKRKKHIMVEAAKERRRIKRTKQRRAADEGVIVCGR